MNTHEGFDMGVEFFKNSQYMQAIDCFNNELSLNSKNGFAWYYKGKCLEKICTILTDEENNLSDRIKIIEKKLQINQLGEKGRYLNINPKNKSQTYGSYKYYQSTTSQLYWGYSQKIKTENDSEDEISQLQERISKLKEEKIQIIQKREKYLEDATQCRISANIFGCF